MRGTVLLLAAGEGTRLGTEHPKALFELDGMTLLDRALHAIDQTTLVDGCVVALPAEAEVALPARFTVVRGGSTRQESAANALAAASGSNAVLVHDAARALAP